MIKTSQLRAINDLIEKALSGGHLSEALGQLEAMATITKAPWNVRSEIERLKQSYGYLRRYALDGVVDPERERMLGEITAGILAQGEAMMRLSEVEESPRQYFSIIRYERLQPDSSITGLLASYRKLTNELSMVMLTAPVSPEMDDLMHRHDDVRNRMFNLLWVSHPLTADEAESVGSFILDREVRVELRAHLMAAVMLGAMEYYDERRMILLAKTYMNGDEGLETKALVALVLAMWVQRRALSGRGFRAVMDVVRERKGWREDLKMVFLNLVRTRDTDRISRTMTEDVIPKMMKLRPEILRKFKDLDNPDEMSSIEDNPEWAELLDKTGVADKLRELNDLQTEGSDVMLSTFQSLKMFPFFHQVANWFLPFYVEQTDAASILGDSAEDLGEVIGMAPMICDSDKYSMVFSLERLPRANRRMMLEQFRMQNIDVVELRNTMLNPELTSRSIIANHYIHDLYRFFTLYRRKGEFKNPFATPINLAAVPMLSADLTDSEALDAVGEFYFKRGYYTEALDVFMLLDADSAPSNVRLQKIGYCRQQLGHLEEALDCYRKSELLAPESLWTQRRIAQCLKLLGRHAEALPYFERLATAKPQDLNLALNLGHTYLALGKFDLALKCYFKVEYLEGDAHRSWRPIAWCSFVEGDYERAEKYYGKILDDTPSATDFLNRGHLFMAQGRFNEAAIYYGRFIEANGGDIAKLDSAINSDMPYLRKANVDPTMIALVADAAQYPAAI